MQQSVISAVDLFQFESTLHLNEYSEAYALHIVWPFVNDGRNLELEERKPRKATGAKLDILFKHGYNELGSCEIGRDQVTEFDDKYLNDGCFKLPKTLRDMFSSLAKKKKGKKEKGIQDGKSIQDPKST